MKQAYDFATDSCQLRMARRGLKRAQVTVPVGDIALIRRLASDLRAGGQLADRRRRSIGITIGFQPARTGEELLAFFRTFPSAGEVIEFERDPT